MKIPNQAIGVTRLQSDQFAIGHVRASYSCNCLGGCCCQGSNCIEMFDDIVSNEVCNGEGLICGSGGCWCPHYSISNFGFTARQIQTTPRIVARHFVS